MWEHFFSHLMVAAYILIVAVIFTWEGLHGVALCAIASGLFHLI